MSRLRTALLRCCYHVAVFISDLVSRDAETLGAPEQICG